MVPLHPTETARIALHASNGAELPLTGVRFVSHISCNGHRTIVEQLFINRELDPIEAVYSFPLPDGAAVCGFEAITGERVLTGVIEEANAGLQKYEDAVQEGHGAFMAEQWRPDVFSTRLGNLKPGQAVLVRLTYVGEAAVYDRSMRIAFPTTLAPRYAPQDPADPVAAAMEADALNPPHVLAVPYGLQFEATIDLGGAVRTIESPSHALQVRTNADRSWSLRLEGALGEMNRELVLNIRLAGEPAPTARVEPGLDGEQFVAVDFVPAVDDAALTGGAPAPRELLFLLDCSGSMEGPSIEQARQALLLCLKAMNEGDRFNICRFGSSHQWMRPASLVYRQQTLDEAADYLAATHANLGGTEIHAPLAEALGLPSPDRRPRDIILLTDGQVTNEPALVQLAAAHKGRARLFTFGIGSAPSSFLIKGLASATGGASEFIAANERIDEKVLRTFARIGSSCFDHLSIDFGAAAAEAEPRELPTLYDGDLLSLIARIPGGATPSVVTLTARRGETTRAWQIPVESAPVGGGSTLAVRWARRRLQFLERDAAANNAALVALSKRYGVLCAATTLLAIEHRSVEERTSGAPALRKVPVMLAQGWGGSDSAVAAGGGTPMGNVCRSAAPMAAKCAAPAPCTIPAPAQAVAGPRDRRAAREEDAKAMFSKGWGNPLTELLMLQKADGTFTDDPMLHAAAINGHDLDAGFVRQLMTLGLPTLAVSTTLAIYVMNTCFPEEAGLWTRSVQKATRWLAAHAPQAKQLLDAALAAPAA